MGNCGSEQQTKAAVPYKKEVEQPYYSNATVNQIQVEPFKQENLLYPQTVKSSPEQIETSKKQKTKKIQNQSNQKTTNISTNNSELNKIIQLCSEQINGMTKEEKKNIQSEFQQIQNFLKNPYNTSLTTKHSDSFTQNEKHQQKNKNKSKKINQEQFTIQIYNAIVSKPHFVQVLPKEFHEFFIHFYHNQYVQPDQIEKLINLLLSYMKFSLSCISSSVKNDTPYTLQNFDKLYAKDTQQLLSTFMVRNNWVTNNLAYMKKFMKKKFDLNNYKEIYQTSHQIKSLCSNDTTSLAYLSCYFVRCCENLQNKKIPIQQINKILKDQARKIKQVFSVTQKANQESQFASKNQSSLKDGANIIKEIKQQYKIKQLIFKTQNKEKQINVFIMNMVQMGKKHFQAFKQITKTVCMKNNGYGYKSNLKLNSESQSIPLLRVKEKLLGDQVKKQYKDKKYPQANTIAKLKQAEAKYLNQVLNKIYQKLEKVPFIVTDILRGKCMFNEMSDIQNSIRQIQLSVSQRRNKGEPIQIVEIRNRLNGITKDVMVLVRFQDIVCEFQLVLKFNQVQNDIHHKMYEIERSITFSPISVLYRWHMMASKKFFQLSFKVIIQRKEEDEQKINLDKSKRFFFYNEKLNLQMYKEQASNQTLNLFNDLMEKVGNISTKNDTIKKQCYFRCSRICKFWGNLEEAIAYHQMHVKLNGQSIIATVSAAQILQKIGKYPEAIKQYQKCTQKIEKNSKNMSTYTQIMIEMAECMMKICKHSSALTKIQDLILVQQKQLGKDSIEKAKSLVLIADVQLDMGKREAALNSYKDAEKIFANQKLLQTEDYADLISKLGYAAALGGKYTEAFNYLAKASNMVGRYSIVKTKTILLMGKVYQQMGRYNQAIQCVNQYATAIRILVNQQSIQFAEALLDLAEVTMAASIYRNVELGLERASEIIQELCGQNSFKQVRCHVLYAQYKLQGQNDIDQAIQLIKEAINIANKFNLPKQNPITMGILHQSGRALARKKQFKQAEKTYAQQQKILKDLYGQNSLQAVHFRIGVAQCKGWNNDYEGGIKLLNKNIHYFQEQKLFNNVGYVQTLLELAYQQSKTSNYKQSYQNYKKAEQIMKLLAGSESGMLGIIYCNWGTSLGKEKEYEEAKTMLSKAAHIYQKIDHPHLDGVNWLLQLLKSKRYQQFNRINQDKQSQENRENSEYGGQYEPGNAGYQDQDQDGQDDQDDQDDEGEPQSD